MPEPNALPPWRKLCPHCGKEVKAKADICVYCGLGVHAAPVTGPHPDTKTCPFCAEAIKWEARVCRFCQRDLPSGDDRAHSATSPGVATIQQATRKQSGVGRMVRLVLLAVVASIILAALVTFGGGAGTSHKTLDVKVAFNAVALEVTNVDAPEGNAMRVYINGTPPFAYRADSEVPARGKSILIPLATFVNKDGDRFNPIVKAVTVVWVGGGGYDYRSFQR